MYAFALHGEGAEAALRRLLPKLPGRVGVIRVESNTAAGDGCPDGCDTEYVLGKPWRGHGTGLSLRDVLDRLAPDHEYAVMLGASDTFLPVVGVGAEPENVIFTVNAVDAFDVPEVIEVVESTEPYVTLESLITDVKESASAEYAGAIATFTGRVRAKEGDGDDRTEYLEFEKYEGIADGRMRTIRRELEDRDGVLEVRLHHRTGVLSAGEDIVFVVVLAGHRAEAFQAVEDGISRLKAEVPLFKKEVTEEETFWVHEREG